ncbi:AAA family ATPase [Tsukamurella soli]|uniref:AAA family ATPase n=1 Tax=Tsukamurella soli TaxID=644556 RepID=UPI0036234F46
MFIERAYVRPEARAELPAWVRGVPALAPVLDGAGLRFTAPVTFLVGENGSGKSTLVEAIAEQYGLDSRGGRASVPGGNLGTPKTPLGEALTLDLTFEGRRLRRAPRSSRCLRLAETLGPLVDSGSQVICATHSPILTALPGAQIVELTEQGPVDVAWRDLGIVAHWRRFLDRPEAYLSAPPPRSPRTRARSRTRTPRCRARHRVAGVGPPTA